MGELFTSTLAPPGLPSPQALSITLDCSHPDPYPEIILDIPMKVFSLQAQSWLLRIAHSLTTAMKESKDFTFKMTGFSLKDSL